MGVEYVSARVIPARRKANFAAFGQLVEAGKLSA